MRVRAWILGAWILLFASPVQAQENADRLGQFKTEIAKFQALPDDICREDDPWDAEKSEQYDVFSAALAVTESALNANDLHDPEPDLRAMVAASAEVNAKWAQDERFDYTITRLQGLWIITFSFRHKVDWYAFGVPGAGAGGKTWKAVAQAFFQNG